MNAPSCCTKEDSSGMIVGCNKNVDVYIIHYFKPIIIQWTLSLARESVTCLSVID